MGTALKGGLVIVYELYLGASLLKIKASKAIRRLLVSYNGAYEEYVRLCSALLCYARQDRKDQRLQTSGLNFRCPGYPHTPPAL